MNFISDSNLMLNNNSLLPGTHDIQNISVSSPQPGEVRVTGDFINGSTATGVLAVIITESEIFYHVVERGRNEQHDIVQFDSTIQGVVGGEHGISFFVVEESGLPFNRTASMPKVVAVENGKNNTIVITNTMCTSFVGLLLCYIGLDIQVTT